MTAEPTALSLLAAADELLAATRSTRVERRDNTQLEALALAVSANLPVLLWGEPGIGKSSALQQLSDRLEVPMETVIASIHEPSDFAGLPVVGDDPATQGVPMAPPDWAVRLAKRGYGLIFFDELSSAPPAVQAALLRVVLERRVGSLELPPAVRVVAAANPPASAADGWHLSPPLANRFVHLHWTHDPAVVARGLAGTWPTADIPPSTRSAGPRRSPGRGARCRGSSPRGRAWPITCPPTPRPAAGRGRRRAPGRWRCGCSRSAWPATRRGPRCPRR
ncbi:AAA family ATPase [Dactylosporangium sp. NBC_01737]|nr:AAA family ATPase [Dactylosporangium sp. NBC_01737]